MSVLHNEFKKVWFVVCGLLFGDRVMANAIAHIVDVLRSKGYTCFAHVTTRKNYESMIRQPSDAMSIDTPYERYMKRVQAHGAYSYMDQNFDKPYVVRAGDFPGVYMELMYTAVTPVTPVTSVTPLYTPLYTPVTPDTPVTPLYTTKSGTEFLCDIHERMTKKMAKYNMADPETVVLIFPLSILCEKKHIGPHWHFNLCDRCGAIGYDTYFHDTIQDVPHIDDVLKYYSPDDYCNEIVFHKSVPLGFALQAFTFHEGGSVCELPPLAAGAGMGVGHDEMMSETKPNYIFYSDMYYSGADISYYMKPDVYTTTAEFYIEFTRSHLPAIYQHLCDNVATKSEMEDVMYMFKCCSSSSGNMTDLITYLHTKIG